ncbi:MAG: radical SAM protein [Bacteroidota bacterium]
MRIYLYSIGCVLRELDLDRVKNYFILNNCEITEDPEQADCIVVSTCAVHKPTIEHSMRIINSMNEYNKQLIVIGCLPAIMPELIDHSVVKCQTLNPQTIHEIDKYFPDFIIPYAEIPLSSNPINNTKSKYLVNKNDLSKKTIIQLSLGKSLFKKLAFYKYFRKISNKESAFLVTSRGCNNHCTYCGIKQAVGKLISIPPDTVIEYYKKMLAEGKKHIIFYADDTASYGEDINVSFSELLKQLDKISPNDITWELDFIHPQKLINHYETILYLTKKGRIVLLECPTQHLSQRILKRMNRNYDITDVIEKLNHIKKVSPSLFLSSHHIAGFPGETEDDMVASIELIKKSSFDFFELLAFFENESCPARKMKGKVKNEDMVHRIITLNHILDKKKILHSINAELEFPDGQIKTRFVTNDAIKKKM